MIRYEVIELLLVAALGAFPSSLLSKRFDPIARVALAPVLGFAIGVDLFTSTLQYWPGNRTSWLLAVLDVLSLAGAGFVVWFRRRSKSLPNRHDLARSGVGLIQLLIVCVAVSAPIVWSFHQAQSVGPTSYQVSDSIVYVNEVDGAQLQTLATAASESNKQGDQLVSFWASYVQADQRLDSAPLLANIDALMGWHATQTQSSFLLVILMIGGFGVFAAVRYFLTRNRWVATIAGAMFGGSFFLQLFFDGSQAALCALALIAALLVLGIVIIRDKHIADCVAAALLLAAFISAYPLYAPEIVIATGAILTIFGLRRALPDHRSGAIASIISGSACAVGVGVLTIAFNTVGYERMLHEVEGYSSSISGQPNYTFLVLRVVPSWLTQSQGLYGLALSTHPVFEDVVLALIAPMILMIFIVVGTWKNRLLLASVPLVGAFVALAFYARVHTYTGFPSGCTYCEDRNLLPLVPILVVLAFTGIAGLLASHRLAVKSIVISGLIVLCGSAAYSAFQSQRQFEAGSYFLPNSVTTLLSRIPANSHGPIEAEGFDEAAPNPVAEMVFTYLAIDERYPGRASWAAGNDENGDQTYDFNPTPTLADKRYQPTYEYVLTRIAGVKTNRKLIARSGSIGLYERANPIDVTVDYGLSVTFPPDAVNATPLPDIWVQEPIQFIVSGGTPKRNVYVRLAFTQAMTSPIVSGSNGSATSVQVKNGRVFVCVTTAGNAPTRTATFSIAPISGTQLLSMSVSYRACKPA